MRFLFSISFVFSACVLGQVVPPGPGFVPVVGIGSANGDHGPAVSGTFSQPSAVVFDAHGNLFIADTGLANVRKVAANRTITTVAGSLTGANLSYPTGLAVDVAGNLYVADAFLARIYRVSTNGVITTFAGDGNSYNLVPRQIAIDSSGNLYATDFAGGSVKKIDPSGTITQFIGGGGGVGFSGDGGPAYLAMIDAVGVAVDANGNVLISGGGRIRKVTTDGNIATLVDGTGPSNKFDGGGLWIGASGQIYMADSANNRVLRFNADGTGMETIAGTGVFGYGDGCGTPGAPLKKLARNAQLANPLALTGDASGAVYIADALNRRVRKVTPDGLIDTVAGPDSQFSGDSGPGLPAVLSGPVSIALDSAEQIYVADSLNNRIRRISSDGTIRTFAGAGGPTGADDPACFAPSDAFLSKPSGIALDAHGNVFVGDSGKNRVLKIAPDRTAETIAGNGQAGFSGDGGKATAARLNAPTSVAVDTAGDVFVSDSMNNVIREVTPDGIIRTVVEGSAGALAVDTAGDLYFGGPLLVYRRTPDGDIGVAAGTGDFQTSIAPGGTFYTNEDLGFAASVAVSPDGTLAVSDTTANRVQRVSPSCAVDDISTGKPGAMAYDANGNLFLAQGGIWKLPAGAVPTIRGPLPALGDIGVLNAASLEVIGPGPGEPPGPTGRAPIAPGEILVLHGICMGPASGIPGRYDSSGMLPRELEQTTVTFDGVAAPLIYVQSGRIELVAPNELTGKSATTMVVTYQGRSVSTFSSVDPGFGGIFTVNGLGSGQAAAANENGTLNSPANPAVRGKLIALYATGLGKTNPAGVDGQRVNGLAKAIEPVLVTIGGQNAKVIFGGDAPGFVGLSQINVIVPEGLAPAAAVPVTMQVGSSYSTQVVTIAIK